MNVFDYHYRHHKHSSHKKPSHMERKARGLYSPDPLNMIKEKFKTKSGKKLSYEDFHKLGKQTSRKKFKCSITDLACEYLFGEVQNGSVITLLQLKKPFIYAKCLEEKLAEEQEKNKQLHYSFLGIEKEYQKQLDEYKEKLQMSVNLCKALKGNLQELVLLGDEQQKVLKQTKLEKEECLTQIKKLEFELADCLERYDQLLVRFDEQGDEMSRLRTALQLKTQEFETLKIDLCKAIAELKQQVSQLQQTNKLLETDNRALLNTFEQQSIVLENSGKQINKLINEKTQLITQREMLQRDNITKGQILNSLNSPSVMLHNSMMAPSPVSIRHSQSPFRKK